MRVYPQIVFIFIFILSYSHARPVKKVTAAVLTNEKELVLEGDTAAFTLQKETLPNAAKNGERKMSTLETKREKASKVSMALSEGSGRSKGDEEKNWKDSFMAFSADYRTPKPHPPKNN